MKISIDYSKNRTVKDINTYTHAKLRRKAASQLCYNEFCYSSQTIGFSSSESLILLNSLSVCTSTFTCKMNKSMAFTSAAS